MRTQIPTQTRTQIQTQIRTKIWAWIWTDIRTNSNKIPMKTLWQKCTWTIFTMQAKQSIPTKRRHIVVPCGNSVEKTNSNLCTPSSQGSVKLARQNKVTDRITRRNKFWKCDAKKNNDWKMKKPTKQCFSYSKTRQLRAEIHMQAFQAFSPWGGNGGATKIWSSLRRHGHCV